MDAYLAFRIAAYLFIAEGAVLLLQALVAQMHGGDAAWLERAIVGGNTLLTALSGALALAAGIGILLGKRVWRWLGMSSAALAAGWALAVVLFSYWPLGPQAWDLGILGQLFVVALSGFQAWAVSTPTAVSYCSE